MPITPNDDKLNIFAVLSADPVIASLGFKKADIERVKTTNEQLTENSQKISIYNNGTEETRNSSIIAVVYQIDISVPIDIYNKADLCGEQIYALLNKRTFKNKHKLIYSAGPVSIACPPAFHCIAYRFIIYETIINKPKIIK